MSLIINSSGKIELLSNASKAIRRALAHNLADMSRLYDELADVAKSHSLNTATGEALDKLADMYGIQRKNACVPSGGYGRCSEESDQALRTRLQYIVRGYA